MHVHGNSKSLNQTLIAKNMIKMGMCINYARGTQIIIFYIIQQLLIFDRALVAGINNPRLFLVVIEDISIFLKGIKSKALDVKHLFGFISSKTNIQIETKAAAKEFSFYQLSLLSKRGSTTVE
jgi:hypothetical protein